MNPVSAQQGDIAEAACVLSALGLVTAFGHVSARFGGVMLITPAADLAGVTESAIVAVPLDLPDSGPLPSGAPAEAWAHLAVYQARPDAGAIARAQPASAFAAGALAVSGAGQPGPGARLLPLYGQAAWLGESVPVHDSASLLRSAELARRAAADLPTGEALLLRGNGALTLGATPALAVTRMWLLAAACAAWLAASGAGPVTPLTAAETESWRSAAGELLPRLWQHLRHQALDPFGRGGGPEPGPPANGGRPARPDLGERSQT